jgi:hypothetical protein
MLTARQTVVGDRGEACMNFRISGLPVDNFTRLLELDAKTLADAGVAVCTVDAPNAYPCRITLEDAEPGEEVLLLSYAHLSGRTPYASSGPIFVRRQATATRVLVNDVPAQQRRRLLSVRAYDRRNWLLDADVIAGPELESLIERFFARADVACLRVHNARHGCYACRIDRE